METMTTPKPARETLFDGISPKRIWLSANNQTSPIEPFRKTDNRFQIAIEVNGIGKIIGDYYIPGLAQDAGTVMEHINLTWILTPLLEELDTLKARVKAYEEEVHLGRPCFDAYTSDSDMQETSGAQLIAMYRAYRTVRKRNEREGL